MAPCGKKGFALEGWCECFELKNRERLRNTLGNMKNRPKKQWKKSFFSRAVVKNPPKVTRRKRKLELYFSLLEILANLATISYSNTVQWQLNQRHRLRLARAVGPPLPPPLQINSSLWKLPPQTSPTEKVRPPWEIL